MSPHRLCLLAVVGLGACDSAAAATAAPSTADAASPVLVELFTSQGCSSCPPADALLQTLADDPNLPIIPLAFHVDYWNYIGWEDPFSDAAWSKRQRAYAWARDSRRVYTPQLLFNGVDHGVGRSESRSRSAIAKATASSTAAVDVEASVAGATINVDLRLDGTAPGEHAAVFVALAQDHASTKVTRGENARRTLSNAFIVRDMKRACDFKPGSRCSATFASPGDGQHVVAWVQDVETMRVHGTGLASIEDAP
ncbi:MAG: DUF1223 domain-containing protein [Myxococcota bacterium]